MHYGWLDFSWRMESEMLMTGLSLVTLSVSLSVCLYHFLPLSLSIAHTFSLYCSFCFYLFYH